MKRILLLSAFIISSFIASAQCSTTNGSGCLCRDASSDCDLLPDITVSWYALQNYMAGPSEYPQVCAPACSGNDGRLRITGSTPNIGYGSFTVRGSSFFVCGTDTMQGTAPSICPDGSAPKQLIVQRIYHRDAAGTMTYTDRWAGAMTYHPTHGHNHVDDWGVFTLRLEDPNDPDPRNWPIVGDGAKLGFCLMDYGQCSGAAYNHHCKDTNTTYNQGTTLYNGDFPNWGLGGGGYNCSPVEQGISVGYLDVYSEQLDGMWVNIPPGTCNGNYWIVAIVDPHDVFLEENEDNNYTAIPITLTQQDAPGNPVVKITSDIGPALCQNSTATLSVTTGFNYLWSTGDTTQTITTDTAGTFYCTVTNYCGTATDTIVIGTLASASDPVITNNSPTVCAGQTASLSATGSNVRWYNQFGAMLGTGNNFISSALTSTTTFYAQDFNVVTGTSSSIGAPDSAIGIGAYVNNDQQYLLFNTTEDILINSVEVYANGAGNRTIMVLDQGGNLVQGGTFNLPDGHSTVNLGFHVPMGTNYQMRVSGNCNLYRNNGGVTYPYFDATNTVKITGSSAGVNFYYYFYNWNINVGYNACGSAQVATTVTVDPCVGIDANADIDALFNVYPNPSEGAFLFTIDVPGTANLIFTVHDLVGKEVYSGSRNNVTGKYSQSIDLGHVAEGVYVLTLNINGKNYHKKIIVH